MGDLTESKGSYETRHKDFSSAMKHAYDHAKRAYGITINPSEIDDKVATGPKKPSRGKTNKYRLKGDRGTIQVQVYNDGNRYELNMYKEDLQEQIEGLKKKSEKSGIPYGILKTVYDRGMAAYKTGHRPGATAQQWAFARVNSFITKGKGTWGGADKDLAAKVKGSTKSEQAPCWDGYKQVGMKNKGGKQVPNCVKMNEASKIPAGMKFIASYVYKDANGKDHTHTHLRKGKKMTDPVVVHIDGKEWKTFQSFTKAKQAAINHIKSMKESVELDESPKVGDKTNYQGSSAVITRVDKKRQAVLAKVLSGKHKGQIVSFGFDELGESVELEESSIKDIKDILTTIGSSKNMNQAVQMVMKKYKVDQGKAKAMVKKAIDSGVTYDKIKKKYAKESVEESLSGAENPPFKSKAGAGEFGTDKLEKTYRKDTPGQSEEVEEMDMKERANKPPKIKRNRGPYTQAQIQKASKHLSPMARTKLMGNLAQMTEELESDIHLDEKIKCPSCDGKGCDHCGGLGYHKESDVEEAIRTKAAQRDELKRREKISTALKGKPQKKTFSSIRSRLTKEESEQVQEAVTVSRKDFDSMKKGDVVNVVFNSSMKKGHKVKLKVKSKTRSAKYDVDKINMVDASDPRNRTKFTFYSRQGKDATLAWGDMGTTLQSYKVESFDAVSEAHCSSSKKKITDEDVAQFIGAASAAKKDGKKEFKFGGKTYPVTISGDTAKKVLEDSFEESFDVSSLIESSDKTDAKEMSAMIRELEPKISPSKLKQEVEKMAMSKYKNKSRAKKISSFV